MQPDRFTIKSQEALQAAQRLADERRNPQTTPEHLLAVMLEQSAGIVAPVLRKLSYRPAAGRRPPQPPAPARARAPRAARAVRRHRRAGAAQARLRPGRRARDAR